MIGFKDREIFLPKMRVAMLATVEGEEERKVSIIGVEQVERAKVEGGVARYCREKRV